jgi:AraC-like DNA-binding protein
VLDGRELRRLFDCLDDVFFSLAGDRGLCLTTRLPLPDRMGACLGIMAVSRRQAFGAVDLESTSVLEKIALEIRKAPGKDYRVATLAEQCNLSPRRFTERFREVFGTPPLEFILRTRVNAAQVSLREGVLSIGQIADLHGFVDQAAFTRHFRRITGMTPGAYRRNDQANET